MNIAKRLLCVLLLWVAATAAAHAEGEDIQLMAFSARNYVLLRWYPQSVEVYRKCKDAGFAIERRTVGESSTWERLEVVKPGSYNDFADLAKKDAKSLIMAFILHKDELLKHADDFKHLADSTESEPIDMSKFEKGPELEMAYAMGLIASEFNPDLAKAAALNYLDERVHTQQNYEYRVVPAGNVKGISSAVLKVSTATATKLANPHMLEIKQTKNNLRMSWSTKDMERDYSGFQLERSTDGKNFKVINDEPIVHIVTDEKTKDKCLYTDTLPKCGQDYYYRYCGLSRFGMKGPYSNVVKVRCEDDYMVYVKLDQVVIDKEGGHLKWTVENPLNQPVKGFYVERVEKFQPDEYGNASFVKLNKGKLLPASARSYIDKNPLESNYYRVVAVGDKPEQVAPSFPQFMNSVDSIPPAPPVGLKGTIDSAGVVNLSWDPNTEPDIYAYRVFFSNTKDGFYVNKSDTFIKVTHFTDTLFLGSLTNDIYYKVLAIDKNYNQGDLSEAIRIQKPDTIAPFRATFDRVEQQPNGGPMEVNWFNSPSEDVVRLELYQRKGDHGDFTLMQQWEGSFDKLPEHYTDTTAFNNESVYYNLICYDYSGNSTKTEGIPVYGKAGRKQCAKDLQVNPDYAMGGVRVKWKKCGCRLEAFSVYRTEEGEQKLLKTVGAMETSYFDKTAKKGHIYKYIVIPESDEFTKAVVSEEIKF